MGKVKLSPWNSADHLKSDEDMAFYLNACLEEGDPALITHALGVIARVRGMTQLAYDMEATGEGGPAFAVVLSAIGVLGFRLQAEPDRR
jgi:probable addiction module antidote protein